MCTHSDLMGMFCKHIALLYDIQYAKVHHQLRLQVLRPMLLAMQPQWRIVISVV